MSAKINVPQLRFREFSGEWETNTIGKISTFFSGGTPTSSNKSYYEGEIPFIGSGKINSSKVEQYITEEALNNSSAKLVNIGDLLYALYGATSGEVAISKIKGAINQAVLCIRTKQNKFFLKTWLEKNKEDILTTYLQGGQGNLSAQIVKSLKINLPQKPEQEKIASFLSAVDAKIEGLVRKGQLLEEYKKGLMQRLFSQELRFKDDDGSEFPEWVEKKLGELGKTYNGLTGKTADDFGSGKPYIQYKQIFDNSKIDIDKFALVNIEEKEKQNIVKYGDVFFTTSSETPLEVGFASVLLDDIKDLYLNSFCFGYRANSLNILNPKFSRFLFRSLIFRKKVIKLAQGSTRYNMSKIELMKIIIKLPSLKEQTKIANFLSAIDTKISQTQTQLNTTKEFKKALLQQMFV